MDPTISTIIIAVITGLFSIITIKIQKNQDKLIKKIEEQTVFIEKEKSIRQKLVQAEKDRDLVIEQMTVLNMKLNIQYVSSLSNNVDSRILEDLKQTSAELEQSYLTALGVVKDVSKEYELLVSVSNELQREFDNIAKRIKNK